LVLPWLVQAGCRKTDGIPPEQWGRSNVVLISIDTCRADHLGCYNPDRPITPNIDALSESATLFVNTVAPAALTLPSHVSMLTGRIPLAHGVHDNAQIVPAENEMLAEILQREGYATAGFVSSVVLAKPFGMAQGFETYDDSLIINGVAQPERTGDQTVMRAIQWLAGRDRSRPFFLFVHLYDPHTPYAPPTPFASAIDDPYAGEVAFADECVGRLLDAVRAEDVYDASVVVVTSDHGEMLGEHGEAEHGYFVYESAIKVPLIIKHPGQRTAERVGGIVGLVDITPSICSIVDVAMPAGLAGRDISQRAEAGPGRPARALYTQSAYPQINYDANSLFGLVEERWKLIWTTSPELYDLIEDPDEQANLIEADPRRARAMQDQLSAIVDNAATLLAAAPAASDAATRRMLESLGYAGSGQRQATLGIDPDKADPKDLLAFHKAFKEVEEFSELGKLDEAIEGCAALARARPSAFGAQYVLASLLIRAGRHEQALASCEALCRLAPDVAATHAMMGAVLARIGRLEDARIALLRAIELAPAMARAHRELGDVCALLARYDEAEGAYQAALARDDRNVTALNNLACLYVDYLDRPAEAVPLAERAMRLAPNVPIIMDTAGWALANVGRYDQAEPLLRAAVAAYSVPETRYHLGWVLEKLGRKEEARREYEAARDLLADERDNPVYPKVIEGLARVTSP